MNSIYTIYSASTAALGALQMGKLPCMYRLTFLMMHCMCSKFTAQSWYHAVITPVVSNAHHVLPLSKASLSKSYSDHLFFSYSFMCVFAYIIKQTGFFFFVSKYMQIIELNC